jgi:hypothetical protein
VEKSGLKESSPRVIFAKNVKCTTDRGALYVLLQIMQKGLHDLWAWHIFRAGRTRYHDDLRGSKGLGVTYK